MATKKVGAAGRFGPRYGKRSKKKLADIELLQRVKQKCPYCKKPKAKRDSKGIWICRNCGKKFTGDVYYIK